MIDLTTNRTQFGGCKESIALLYLSTCPVGFVFTKTNELAPASVLNGLGQVMIFEHPIHVQILKSNEAEPLNQAMAQLVVKILALTSNPLMLDSYLQSGFSPIVRAFLFAAQPALANLQPALRLSEIFRWLDFLTGRERDKILEAQINANSPLSGLRVSNLNFTLDRDEKLTALGFRDGNTLHLTLNRAVERRPDAADFRQFDPTPLYLKPLRVADRLIVILAFECRIAQGHPILARLLAGLRLGEHAI